MLEKFKMRQFGPRPNTAQHRSLRCPRLWRSFPTSGTLSFVRDTARKRAVVDNGRSAHVPRRHLRGVRIRAVHRLPGAALSELVHKGRLAADGASR